MMGSKKILLIICCLGPSLTGLIYGQRSDVATSVEVSADEGLSTIPVVLDLKRPSDTDILKLRNGDQLTGTVLNESFSIRTSYAQISLNNRIMAGIDLEGGANNIEAIVTVNNNRFSGFIDDPVFVFKLQAGAEIRVRREKVLKVIFRVREQERKGIPQRQFFLLKNGDFFSGQVKNKSLSVATTYAKIPVNLSQVDRISFIGGKNALTRITIVNGDVVQGVLETEDIELSLDVGGDFKVYQDRVDTLYCKTGYVPEGFVGTVALSGNFRGPTAVLDIGNGIKMKFALIPGGEFVIGSPDGESNRDSDEGPQHKVKLTKPFYMLTTEVTQQQYSQIMGTNPSKFKGMGNPVEQVSWNDAMEFCRKLSEKTERQIRLPTEAEWEYACRAGTNTTYCFGGDEHLLGSYGWYSANSNKQTHPVAAKKPNAWGLYDMHGNVWEWCSDRYGENYYSSSPSVDPEGPSISSSHVIRGGSWFNISDICRSANRRWGAPYYRRGNFGFRPVLDLK